MRIGWLVCAVFFADFLVSLWLAPRKWDYLLKWVGSTWLLAFPWLMACVDCDWEFVPEGRVLAVVLMIAGVGLFGTFTASVASLFISSASQEKQLSELELLRTEVQEVRSLIEKREQV